MNDWTLRRVDALDAAQVEQLAGILMECVALGASVSFKQPLTRERALAFWHGVANGLVAGDRALLVAEDSEGLCGTVQINYARSENQQHRADVTKLLVHPRARRKGLGEALAVAVESLAKECGKTLLILDTATPEAERLYDRLGWQRIGVIPDFALAPDGSRYKDTVLFFKKVA
ncbi:GNAT family N-acetyltransferase [Betaproteobacteria bacterium GR16-43]|nr:GNAT family N-acetyltransferase [Betaproteobacteria bacterium GR16-43]